MQKILAPITILGAPLAGCGTPAPGVTVAPRQDDLAILPEGST